MKVIQAFIPNSGNFLEIVEIDEFFQAYIIVFLGHLWCWMLRCALGNKILVPPLLGTLLNVLST